MFVHLVLPSKVNESTGTCVTFLCAQPNGNEERKLLVNLCDSKCLCWRQL